MVMNSATNDYLFLSNFYQSSFDFQWSKSINLSVVSFSQAYSELLKIYVLIFENSANKIWLITVDPENGDVVKYKLGSSSLYRVSVDSLNVKEGNLYLGGQYSSMHYFVYRFGIHLGDYSWVFNNARKKNVSSLNINSVSPILISVSLSLNSDTTVQYLNRTSNGLTAYSSLSPTFEWYPSIHIPYIDTRYFSNRFMETLPEIWKGFKTPTISSNLTFDFTNSKDVDSNIIEGKSIQTYSFYLEKGQYEIDIKITDENKPNEYSLISYDLNIELSVMAIISTSITCTWLFWTVIYSAIKKDFFLLKQLIFSLQFIHLSSLSPITLTPTYAWYVQSISIFSFLLGPLGHFMLSSFKMIPLDAYYTSNYETSSLIGTQLSILLTCLALLLPYAFFYVLYDEYITHTQQKKSTRNHLKNLKLLIHLTTAMLPHFWIHCYVQMRWLEMGSGLEVWSVVLAFWGWVMWSVIIVVWFWRNMFWLWKKWRKMIFDEKTWGDYLIEALFWMKILWVCMFLMLDGIASDYYVPIGVFVSITIPTLLTSVLLLPLSVSKSLIFLLSHLPSLMFSMFWMTMVSHKISYLWREKGSQRFVILMSWWFLLAFLVQLLALFFKEKKLKRRKENEKEGVDEEKKEASDITDKTSGEFNQNPLFHNTVYKTFDNSQLIHYINK
jgi:hypothetical protein